MTKITAIIRVLWVITIISIIFINISNRILASGGDSEAVFKISTKQNSILGYIDGNSSLEAGCGTLIHLSTQSSSIKNIKIKNQFSQIVPFNQFSETSDSLVIGNGCDLPQNTLFLQDGKVLYHSLSPISSFQFDVDNSNSILTIIIIFVLIFLTIITVIRAIESRNEWREMIKDGDVEVKDKISFD